MIFNNEKVERKRDYYVVDRKIWDFLHGIYGGGPILHKQKKEVNSETVSVRSSTTSLGTNIGNVMPTENYQNSFIDGSIADNQHQIIAEEDNEEDYERQKNERNEILKKYSKNNIIIENYHVNEEAEGDYDEGEYDDDEGEYEGDESEITNLNNAEFNIIGLKNPSNY